MPSDHKKIMTLAYETKETRHLNIHILRKANYAIKRVTN